MTWTPRHAAAAAATLAIAATAALGGAASATAGSCTPGVKTIKGGFQRTFCGPAKVTVKVGGRTITLSQGSCEKTSGYLAVNIGVFSSTPTPSSRPNYFGLVVGRAPGSSTPPAPRDGTYRSGIVMTMVYRGTGYSAVGNVTATLSGNRTRGVVTGTTLTHQTMTANFHC